MNPSARGRSVRFVLRASTRIDRAFLHELTADHAVLVLPRPLEQGTALFLGLHSLDPRLSRTPLATVGPSVLQAPGRWLVRCRFALPLNAGELGVARAA